MQKEFNKAIDVHADDKSWTSFKIQAGENDLLPARQLPSSRVSSREYATTEMHPQQQMG